MDQWRLNVADSASTLEVYTVVSTVPSANDSNVTMETINAKYSWPIVEQGWMVQVMHPPNKFEPRPF
jgi:hypothetical protein